MSRNATARFPWSPAEPWLGAALALTLAVGAGLLLTELMMAPPAGELREMAAYLTFSGAATMLLGWLALRVAPAGDLSIRARTFLGASMGAVIALLNVLVVAQLMFVSTSHDLRLLVALVVFSGIVTTCFTMFVAAAISERIVGVATGIRTLAMGNYDARVAEEGGDEVSRLARDVNALATRLQDAEHKRETLDRERRDLTAAISHDLRTPLASVLAMVEALDDGVINDPEEIARYYATIGREMDRLSRMIDDLFELARIDAGVLQLDLRQVPVQEIAAEVVDAMQAQARRQGVALELTVEAPAAAILLDGARMERAVGNLVRNALEHTPSGGRVEVSVDATDECVRLQVRDTGRGLEPGQLSKIWDRFYRGDQSRTRGDAPADGAGLGLAIVRGMVEAHGGAVSAASEHGGGAVFTIQLPRGATGDTGAT